MTYIAQPVARARYTPARIVVESIGGCIIASVQPVAGCETVIFERRAPVRIALVALPVAPVLAIFLARIAQVAALFADVAAIAVTDRLADVALLFANFLPVAAKFAGLGLGHCGNQHRGDQAGGGKLDLLHFSIVWKRGVAGMRG